jgi:hypothetical protein
MMQQMQNFLKMKKTTTFAVFFLNLSWWNIGDVNGTLEEWMKKSDAEFTVIDDEIRGIRELLSE